MNHKTPGRYFNIAQHFKLINYDLGGGGGGCGIVSHMSKQDLLSIH